MQQRLKVLVLRSTAAYTLPFSVLVPFICDTDTAEKNLSGRTSFPWTVVRPGSLLDQDAVGSITLGQHARIDVPVCTCSHGAVSTTVQDDTSQQVYRCTD